MPAGLAAFLTERLDEAEAIARAASSDDEAAGRWHVSRQGTLDSAATTGDDSVGCPDGCHPSPAQAEHIAANDPARTLRAIAGKRKILTEHNAVTELAELTGQELGFLGWYREWVLKNFAAEWDDHPAYQPEWSPEPATAP